MDNFKILGIDDVILNVIAEKGFTKPTNIQKKAIPFALKYKNLVISAPTGTGKTLIYIATIIEKTKQNNTLQAIVLAPTRELAEQIHKTILEFCKYKPLNILIMHAGHKLSKQSDTLFNAEIIIATPSVLLKYINSKSIDVSSVETFVLDEVDTLIKTEFKDEVTQIIEYMSRRKQTLMLSATADDEIAKLANKYMRNPVRISAGEQVDEKKLKQTYYEVSANLKLSLLVHLIKNEKAGLSIIFANKKDTVRFIAKNIKHLGFEIVTLDSQTTTGRRNKAVDMLYNQKFDILIATDIAARGLDIENITHVYNYNIPADETKYIHRIGRCARAGNYGKVINFIAPKDIRHFLNIAAKYKIFAIKKEIPHNIELIEIRKSNHFLGKNKRDK